MPTSSLQDKKYYSPEPSQHLPYFKDSAVGSDSTVSLSLVKVAAERQTLQTLTDGTLPLAYFGINIHQGVEN